MKKILPILILLAFVAFIYQFLVNFFTTEHEVTYSLIANDQRHYTITEKYQKKGSHNYYSFLVQSKNKKKNYVMAIEEDFKKQDQIISDIKHYKKHNLECIFPIYQGESSYDVSCLLEGEQVSSYYLQQTSNEDFSYIIDKAKKDGYQEIYYQENATLEKEDNLSIYYDYIPESYIFTIWNYKGIDVVKSDGVENVKFLNSDYYENRLSTVVGNYYVTINTDNEEDELNYYQLIIYDLVDGGKSVVEVDISQDSYFNGVSDGLLYITDPKAKKQYVLDPVDKKVWESETIYEVSNSKLQEASKDFFDSVSVDNSIVFNKKITKKYDTKEIKKDKDSSYFITNDGKIYCVIQDVEHPVLLCQFDDIKEWQVHDDGVSFIVDDTLYLYTDFYGLKPILVNPEFPYNSKNIYHFIREE